MEDDGRNSKKRKYGLKYILIAYVCLFALVGVAYYAENYLTIAFALAAAFVILPVIFIFNL